MDNESSLTVENVFFPEDILMKILSYVEAKYLLRCKSVCKLWYDVIGSKQLVEMQMIRNGLRYYDMHTIGKSLNSNGIREYITHKYHRCRGLVLLGFSIDDLSSTSIRIYNPTTNFSIDLPHPHKRVKSIHVFLNTCTDSYNVLSIYLDVEKNTRHLELLDLGGQSNDPRPNTDLSWKTLNIPEFESFSTHQRYYSKYCMSTEGSILYVLTRPYSGSIMFKITCVDIVTLTCTTLDMPLDLCFDWYQSSFRFWRGKPSVVFVLEDELNILALEDYKTRRWADTVVFPLPSSLKKKWIDHPHIYAGDMLDILYYDKERLSVYELESKVMCHKAPATLISVKGMQPQKKEPRIKLDTACR